MKKINCVIGQKNSLHYCKLFYYDKMGYKIFHSIENIHSKILIKSLLIKRYKDLLRE